MRAPHAPQQKFFYVLLGVAAFLLVGGIVASIVRGEEKPKPRAEATLASAKTGCGASPAFYARLTPGNQFGTPAPEDPAGVAATQAEFAKRRCVDPALLVADSEYLFNEFSSPEARVKRTLDLSADPKVWQAAETRFADRLAQATKVEIITMSGRYKTMDMEDKDRMVPEIYQVNVEKAPFRVIRYTFADGTVKQFKLNCGFQPVEQSFPPSVPGKGAPPARNQPPGRPEKPGTSVPPTSVVPGKCANQTGPYCGTPDSGPEFIPPQQNDPALVAPTPGYTPGGAETVIPSQQPKPGSDPYAPTPYGTNTGGSQTGPTGGYTGPGATTGGTPAGTSGVTNDPLSPQAGTEGTGQTSGAGSDPGGF